MFTMRDSVVVSPLSFIAMILISLGPADSVTFCSMNLVNFEASGEVTEKPLDCWGWPLMRTVTFFRLMVELMPTLIVTSAPAITDEVCSGESQTITGGVDFILELISK